VILSEEDLDLLNTDVDHGEGDDRIDNPEKLIEHLKD